MDKSQLNVAFDRLRGVMPDVKTITKEEKDTKVESQIYLEFSALVIIYVCIYLISSIS